MSVHLRIDVPDVIYRDLVRVADSSGTKINDLISGAVARASGRVTPFEQWAATLDPAEVEKERIFVPPEVMAARLFQSETNRYLAYLRTQRGQEGAEQYTNRKAS